LLPFLLLARIHAAVDSIPACKFVDSTEKFLTIKGTKVHEGNSTEDTMATTTELPVTLNKDEILRYSRHLIMPEVGMEGQQ